MAAATVLDVLQFPIVDPDDLQGRVIHINRGFGCWRVHFWGYILYTMSRSRSNIRSNVKLRNFNV